MSASFPPELVFLSWPEVCRLTRLSQSTIRRMQARGEFPAATRLSVRRVGFLRSNVAAWQQGRTIT